MRVQALRRRADEDTGTPPTSHDMNRLLAALALLLLPGCFISRVHVNDPIPAEVVATIEPGRTTAAEVVQRLGAPSDVVQLGKRSAYRFDHTARKSAALYLVGVNFQNADEHSDRVWVWFDEYDVVTHVGVSLDADKVRYGMPWSGRD